MKLSQDQIKKIFLSLIGLVALVYCYLSFLLEPLQASQAGMINETAEIEMRFVRCLQNGSRLERNTLADQGKIRNANRFPANCSLCRENRRPRVPHHSFEASGQNKGRTPSKGWDSCETIWEERANARRVNQQAFRKLAINSSSGRLLSRDL